jgi:hypothetical protein
MMDLYGESTAPPKSYNWPFYFGDIVLVPFAAKEVWEGDFLAFTTYVGAY